MPAAIIEFVDVSVNVQGGVADKFSFGTLMGVFDHSVTANRQDGPYFSLAEVVAAGFTSGAEPEVNAWATAAFAQDDGVDQILIGREDAGDANWTATMDAIELAGSDTWYITNIESRVDADVLEVAAWTEARDKIFIAQTASADLLAGTPANIGEQLKNFGYNRTALIYHATSTGTDGYLDGAWSSSGGGLNLDVPGGVGIWAYRQLEGVTFDAVTGAQATNIYAENANLFGRNLGLSFTSKGTMAVGSPRFIDVTTTVDWTKKRIEEATLSLFVATPTKIPYTNGGINQIVGVVQGVLDSGVTFGHFSPDFPPTIEAPDVANVSSADKQNRELTLTAEAVLAGAVQKLILTVNLSF
jgi:hypothetical protein